MNSARHHTDQAHAEGDTTRIISEPTPTESMIGMEGGAYRAVLTDTGPVELPDDAVTRRLFGEPAYMSPKVIREKLRACSAHNCRAVGCVNKVWVCGNYCERCAKEVAALEKHYAEENRKAAGAFWPMASLALLAFAAACYVCAVKAGWP